MAQEHKCKGCKHYQKMILGFGRCCPPLPKWLSARYRWYQIWGGRDYADGCAMFELEIEAEDSPQPEPKFIEHPFQRVTVGDDDVIVVNAGTCLSQHAVDHLTDSLKRAFPGRRAIVLEQGMTLGVVAKEDIPEPKEPEVDSSAARCSVCVHFSRPDDFDGHCSQQWTHLGYRRLGGKKCRFFKQKGDQ